jgi:23S rRNA (cytidine1920-2'-O)/16S rRNA (cytidine1409-2'-O)-methyltransferase
MVEKCLADSRSQAQRLIMAGVVYCSENRVDKAGDQLDVNSELVVRQLQKFVSRGGDKLDAALVELNIGVVGLVCADIGASTGGFTDCMLQRGAIRVYAIDVGHAQLAHKLRLDERVICREGVNARHLKANDFPERIDFITVDASFIGLDLLLSAIADMLPADGQLLALVKPQFEVGRKEASRTKGVIRDPQLRQAAISNATAAIASSGFEILGSCDSQVPGPKGNIEHFVWARRTCPAPNAAS